jgi:hypothetical protein
MGGRRHASPSVGRAVQWHHRLGSFLSPSSRRSANDVPESMRPPGRRCCSRAARPTGKQSSNIEVRPSTTPVWTARNTENCWSLTDLESCHTSLRRYMWESHDWADAASLGHGGNPIIASDGHPVDAGRGDLRVSTLFPQSRRSQRSRSSS